MAVKTNITINIVEPGSDVPVPDTGLFTHSVGGPEATAIGAVLILTIAAIIVTILYRKQKKVGKVTKLVHLVDSTKAVLKSKKRITAGLTALALLASAGTLTALLTNAGKSNTNAAEGDNGLTLDVSSKDLTIEVGDTPVFAVLPVELTVEEATPAGYTLTTYTTSTDIVSTTNPNNKIPMVTVEGDELTSLQDNTWGLALDNEPEAKDNKVYTALSTDQTNPTIIKTIDDYSETPANDTTTIYYGFYITPDTPYGTYTSGDISYNAEINRTDLATVTFDGSGLYFNDNPEQTTNTVRYEIVTSDRTEKYSHTSNIDDEGVAIASVLSGKSESVTIPNAATLHISFTYGGGSLSSGFASFWVGNHTDYTPENDYSEGVQNCGGGQITDGRYYSSNGAKSTVECDIPGNTVTFGYSFFSSPSNPEYGYYAVVTGYDTDGNIVYLKENNLIFGDYLTPSSEDYSKFIGWDKNPEATIPAYPTEESIKEDLSLTIDEATTLYAIWETAFTISYNGNGAGSKYNMDNIEQYTTDLETKSKQVDLLASNFKRDGYGFIGWSEDKDAYVKLQNGENPVIYGPNQTITVDPTASAKLDLYAIWVPVETTASGEPVELQEWRGCPNLDITVYDVQTGTLTVGKNTITALTDARDNSVYAVARLADGNCWITENLRLDNSMENKNITKELSSTNTNKPSLPLTNNYSEQTTSNRLSASSSSWCWVWGEALCLNQSIINTNNIANTITAPTFNQDFTNHPHDSNFDANIWSYGVYYNWYSATAGNGKSETVVAASGDLCPVGWHLPYGGNGVGEKGGNTKGGFYYLNQQMGGGTSSVSSNNWRSFPNNFIYSGEWSSRISRDRGNRGDYWSSTGSITPVSYYLRFSNDGVNPTSDENKGNGYSVRCLTPAQ